MGHVSGRQLAIDAAACRQPPAVRCRRGWLRLRVQSDESRESPGLYSYVESTAFFSTTQCTSRTPESGGVMITHLERLRRRCVIDFSDETCPGENQDMSVDFRTQGRPRRSRSRGNMKFSSEQPSSKRPHCLDRLDSNNQVLWSRQVPMCVLTATCSLELHRFAAAKQGARCCATAHWKGIHISAQVGVADSL